MTQNMHNIIGFLVASIFCDIFLRKYFQDKESMKKWDDYMKKKMGIKNASTRTITPERTFMNESNNLVVDYNRRAAIAMSCNFLFALLLIALFLFFLNPILASISSNFLGFLITVLIKGFLGLASAFLVTVLVMYAFKALTKQPCLTLTQDGIQFHRHGFVEWEDIALMELRKNPLLPDTEPAPIYLCVKDVAKLSQQAALSAKLGLLWVRFFGQWFPVYEYHIYIEQEMVTTQEIMRFARKFLNQ